MAVQHQVTIHHTSAKTGIGLSVTTALHSLLINQKLSQNQLIFFSIHHVSKIFCNQVALLSSSYLIANRFWSHTNNFQHIQGNPECSALVIRIKVPIGSQVLSPCWYLRTKPLFAFVWIPPTINFQMIRSIMYCNRHFLLLFNNIY